VSIFLGVVVFLGCGMVVVVVGIEFVAVRAIPIVSWSGSFVSAIAREAARDVGAEIVSVAPLYRGYGGGVLLCGSGGCVVDTGSRLWTRFTYRMSSSGGYMLIEAIQRAAAKRGLDLVSIELRVFDESSIDMSVPDGDRYVVRVRFDPTIFVFRGWRVLYPSPSRLLHSSAKIATELLKLEAREMKKLSRRVSRCIELLSSRTRVIELDIGGGRKVRAFYGEAIYGVYGRENARTVKQLLTVAEVGNIGKSRGIGFGVVRLVSIEPQR